VVLPTQLGQLLFSIGVFVKYPDDMYVNINASWSTFYQCEFVGLLHNCKYSLKHRYGIYKGMIAYNASVLKSHHSYAIWWL